MEDCKHKFTEQTGGHHHDCPSCHEETEAQWEKDCLRYGDKVLTGKWRHWCPDWDGLPIDETTPEFDCCTCPKE